MKISIAEIISLLHTADHATLATQSLQLRGYPYATVVPCVVDEMHRPIFLVSQLAEHTKNLLADARTSLSVMRAEGNAQTTARLTLLGDTERLEPSPEMIARYLRYHPDAEQYLALDFTFFRMQPQRVRFIGGIGRMGWLESEYWCGSPGIPLAEEAFLLQDLAKNLHGEIRLLGVDCHGVDYTVNGHRARSDFNTPASSAEEIGTLAAELLTGLAQ
ncbi:MAG: pyridoxamine 5-phosphate oxidase family protein [Rhodocyclales bacterium]|nr:pyridoxamine 5-phosphate oxidase family protein [Rhodocyclales bacterium]